MQQIAQWLEEIGLSEYAQRFAENGIDISVVRHLTEQDLKDIGVLLGHRRKMLAAIGDLTDATRAATPSAPATTDLPAVDGAERRQLTVMFCDLVGSTALSAKLDPEDLRGIIGAYHRCCAELVVRNGGFVAKYMGDGVLAYFGYPQAHEHDAERSVQAGLALVEALPKLATAAGFPLSMRVGIATGLVVVGDLIGSGEAQERGIVGETPNLAARLQGIAEPNTVVIADGTRNLLGNLFELKDLGARDLKGIPEPARAWAALRVSSVGSRFDALHTGGLTALVGREEEFELLLRRWSRAKTGQGQVVLLLGEAGIGKSRLTAALLEGIAADRTRGCAIFARRNIRTARSIRSSARWNAPLGRRTTTNHKRAWTSSMRCSRRPRPRRRTSDFSRRCCRSRMMDDIPRSIWPRSNAGKEPWKR